MRATGVLRGALFAALVLVAAPAAAAPLPHVGARAEAAYQTDYRYSDDFRAFAIAPGGAWGWRAGQADRDTAGVAALEACERHTDQRCQLYALGDEVVFDAARWAQGWRPYADAAQAAAAPAGTGRGERLPDLRLTDPEGRAISVAALRGRIVVLHLWGSWCPPCLDELPSLASFADRLGARHGAEVALVLAQVREPLADSAAWLARQGLQRLPLHDSGSSGPDDRELTLTDGNRLADRILAPRFPASYVLDRFGLVLMRKVGPVHDWMEMMPLLDDAVSAAPR